MAEILHILQLFLIHQNLYAGSSKTERQTGITTDDTTQSIMVGVAFPRAKIIEAVINECKNVEGYVFMVADFAGSVVTDRAATNITAKMFETMGRSTGTTDKTRISCEMPSTSNDSSRICI